MIGTHDGGNEGQSGKDCSTDDYARIIPALVAFATLHPFVLPIVILLVALK